jgi:hypothetical protein
MFRCSLDELTEYLKDEFPIPVPGVENVDLLPILNQGTFGEQASMGIKWNREKILITDYENLMLPLRLEGENLYIVRLLRMTITDGKAVYARIPEREPRLNNSYGKHRIQMKKVFLASDNTIAAKLALLAPALIDNWLTQFKVKA